MSRPDVASSNRNPITLCEGTATSPNESKGSAEDDNRCSGVPGFLANDLTNR
jgi:hypothetical protein